MTLECKILLSDAEVEAIAPEWQALYRALGGSIYMDYDWFAIWWRTLGQKKGKTLHIVTGWRDGRLVGLLPLTVLLHKGFRKMQFIGTEVFYCCDMLCENREDAAALWRAARLSPHYDFAHIYDVWSDAAWEPALSSFAHLRDIGKIFSLRLNWPSGQAWKAQLPAKFRRNLNKRISELEKKGALSYSICEGEPVPMEIIESMVTLKKAWCEANGKKNMFDQPGIREYLRQIAQNAAGNGTLMLAWLKCGDAVIAYHLLFKFKKTLYSYIIAADQDWSKYGPGIIAHVNAIVWAIDNGFTIFNHLQGEKSAHNWKHQFSNEIQDTPEYTFSNTLRGWVGEQLFAVRRVVKKKWDI